MRAIAVLFSVTACSSTPVTTDGGTDASPMDVVAQSDVTSDTTTACGYDAVVLADQPVAFWAMNHTSTEPDLTGHGHDGAYKGGAPSLVAMPDGCDEAARFDGATQYLTVPSSGAFSITTTGDLTWEAWIRPDVLDFPNESNGYVDWMGKCADYSPTCEWEARMYDTTNTQGRVSRISAYIFNPSAGLGSAADWQPATGVIVAGAFHHVVAQYTLHAQPSDCQSTTTYPGSIEIWLDGVQWNHSFHGQTGCMSQYSVVPKANGSPLNIGTMALDSFFEGAIGKVAIYDKPLGQARISAHFEAMTNKAPSGSCNDTCSL